MGKLEPPAGTPARGDARSLKRRRSPERATRDRKQAPRGSAHIVKIPQQARSKKRVAGILEATRGIVSDVGAMALKMSAVAVRAGVPIGSLYQYFPTKAALLYRLFESRLEEFRANMRFELNKVECEKDFIRTMHRLVMRLYEENRGDPFMRELWAGVQASPETRKILAEDNAFYSDLFFQTARRAGSRIAAKRLRRRAVVINEMWDSALRSAITMEDGSGLELLEESLDIGLNAFFRAG